MIPYVKEWVPARLRELYELASSSDWELVGKTVGLRDERSGSRFGSFVEGQTRRVRGGWSDVAPEVSYGPKQTASAIRRGKGIVFRKISAQVARYAVRAGWARYSRKKRPSVPPHKAQTRKCSLCGVPHTRKQHKFHGSHSFHKTHAWSFPSMTNKKRFPSEYSLVVILKDGREYPLRQESLKGAKIRAASIAKSKDVLSVRILKDGREVSGRKNPASPMPLLYGKVLRVEAQKTQRHVCDSECKKVGHRYYHDFSSGPDMLGIPSGSRLVLPDGTAYKVSERSLLITKSLRRGSR